MTIRKIGDEIITMMGKRIVTAIIKEIDDDDTYTVSYDGSRIFFDEGWHIDNGYEFKTKEANIKYAEEMDEFVQEQMEKREQEAQRIRRELDALKMK